jgi:hypothetical protein
MTPSKMMLGREINLPSELIFKNAREELFENEEQYVTSLRTCNNIKKIHEIARKTLKTAQETMKRDYDSKMREVEYQPGDFVCVGYGSYQGKSQETGPLLERPRNYSGKIITLHIQNQA